MCSFEKKGIETRYFWIYPAMSQNDREINETINRTIEEFNPTILLNISVITSSSDLVYNPIIESDVDETRTDFDINIRRPIDDQVVWKGKLRVKNGDRGGKSVKYGAEKAQKKIIKRFTDDNIID